MIVYENFYNGIDNKLNIYDSFNTAIALSTRENISETNANFTIDNTGQAKMYPVVEFTNPSFSAGQTIINGAESVVANSAITGSSLVLNFDKQIYELDGVNIINSLDFGSDRFYIAEDTSNSISLSAEGTISYYSYPDVMRERFVENFQIVGRFTYNGKGDKIDEEYEARLGGLTVDNNMWQDIVDGKKFRIEYTKQNMETGNYETKYLLDCVFTSWDEGFTQTGDIIMHNIVGESTKLI